MTLRACLAVIAAATPLLMAASEVTAAPGAGYSAQDKATIETCIETAQRNAQRANVCIGTAALLIALSWVGVGRLGSTARPTT